MVNLYLAVALLTIAATSVLLFVYKRNKTLAEHPGWVCVHALGARCRCVVDRSLVCRHRYIVAMIALCDACFALKYFVTALVWKLRTTSKSHLIHMSFRLFPDKCLTQTLCVPHALRRALRGCRAHVVLLVAVMSEQL